MSDSTIPRVLSPIWIAVRHGFGLVNVALRQVSRALWKKCRRLTSSVKMYCRASVIGSRATPYEQYVSGYMTALDESSTRSGKKMQAVVSQVGLA